MPAETLELLRRGRPHAAAVQLLGQPASVSAPWRARTPRSCARPWSDLPALAADRPVGQLPAQQRRAGPGPAERRGPRAVLRGIRARADHAAVRARDPPTSGTDAAGRPTAPRAHEQPAVQPARHAGDSIRRGDRHGRRPEPARAERDPHADAVVGAQPTAASLSPHPNSSASPRSTPASTVSSRSTSPCSGSTTIRS